MRLLGVALALLAIPFSALSAPSVAAGGADILYSELVAVGSYDLPVLTAPDQLFLTFVVPRTLETSGNSAAIEIVQMMPSREAVRAAFVTVDCRNNDVVVQAEAWMIAVPALHMLMTADVRPIVHIETEAGEKPYGRSRWTYAVAAYACGV